MKSTEVFVYTENFIMKMLILLVVNTIVIFEFYH